MRALVVSLLSTAVILVLAFSMVAQGSPPPDPFLPYSDLLAKGQMLAAIESRNGSCRFELLEASQICSLEPEAGIFSDIRVTIVNGVPTGVSFQINKNTLRVGDLVVLWGQPAKQKTRSILSWSEGVMARAVVGNELNYLAPVWVVSFTF
jgi:hypothetical protein